MKFDIVNLLDLQSFQVQALLGYGISWLIQKAVGSQLPILGAVRKSWARWLSLGSSLLVAFGIHASWMGDYNVLDGGTINLALMIPSLSDLVNFAFQFFMNELSYKGLVKPTSDKPAGVTS